MSRLTVALLALASIVNAQSALTSKHFTYGDLPTQVDTDPTGRGPQSGVNNCSEATTGGQNSQCQTMMVNSIDDFCLWGGPAVDSIVANTEAASVAWCTKPGRGTRVIPAGSLTGVQFMKTPDYVQVVGFINQANIDIQAGDGGGELDPHGDDERGNPLGGLVFSNAFPSNGGNLNNFQQVVEWHNFMGGNVFCIKACDPAGPNAANFCQHIYDRIGCDYNAPAAYVDGVFESCLGDDQDFPGVYTVNGVAQTYAQPPESLGPITSIPYVARIPASSQCVTAKSTDLYAAAATVTASNSAATSSASVSKSVAKVTKSSGTSAASATGTNAAFAGSAVSGFAAILAGAIALVARL